MKTYKEILEAASIKSMSDKQLLAWYKKNATDEQVSPVFGRQLLMVRKELQRRKIKIK